jgi:phosphatidylglycerol:prolipoprotein diacylglycerol transferase
MHPILFQLGPLTLRSYGLAMAISFVLGITVAVLLNRRNGRPDELILDVSTWIMVGAVVGARLLYVIVEPQDYLVQPWRVFAVWEGGLVYYGGLIGASLATYAYLKWAKAPLWSVADCLAPGLALGQVTGRMGCYFNGCCYGVVDHAHGVVFPSVADGEPHLPVMLYEAAFCLALGVYLAWYWRRKSYDGQVFWSYVLLYAIWRFFIEFLRGDAERGTLFSAALSPSQWISLAGLGLALAALARLPRTLAAKAT